MTNVRKIQFGVGLGTDLTIHEVAECARTADQCGFSHVTFVDLNSVSRDVNFMMAVAALNTSRIQIGQGVTEPKTNHPAAIANATATLRELTGGRAFVGIGAGGPWGKTLTRGAKIQELREAVQFIKRYSAGEDADWKGQTWHSEWIRNSSWAGRPLPVYMGVVGPRAMELAGELADAVWIRGLDAEVVRWYRELIERGAHRSGRDPSTVAIWIRTQCYVADSKEAALPEVASYAASQAANLWSAVFCRERPDIMDLRQRVERKYPGLIDEMKRIHDAIDDSPAQRVSQKLVDFLHLTGPSEEICETVHAMQNTGVTGISAVMYAKMDQPDMIRRIANEITRHFR